jgi:predicted nuclease with TOPRIM domain
MDRDVINVILAVLGSGGLLGGIYALLKLRPEAGQITVTAAEGVVMMQSGVLERMEGEAQRYRDRLDALEAEMRTVDQLRQRISELERESEERGRRIADLESERVSLKADNARLLARVASLEAANNT